MANVQELIDRVLNDAEFRKQLLANPETLLRENGVEPTQEILSALKDIDEEALQEMAQELGADKIAAGGC